MVVIKTALEGVPHNCYQCEYTKDVMTLCGETKTVCMLTGDDLYGVMDLKSDSCPLLEHDTGWIDTDQRLPEPMKYVIVVTRDSRLYPAGKVKFDYLRKRDKQYFLDVYSHWRPLPLPPGNEVNSL